MFYYVYILVSLKDGKFYIGSTGDLRKRIQEHTAGEVTSTKNRRPLELIGYEGYKIKFEALKREIYLKSSDARKEMRIRFKKSLSNIVMVND